MKIFGTLLILVLAAVLLPARALGQWPADGAAVSTAPNDQSNAVIVPDGVGGAIITWSDSRGPDTGIYAQRINSTGAVLWMVDGTGICAYPSPQRAPTITSDGAGGAIIAWYDERGSGGDIYAQHIDYTGVTKWNASGVAVCTAVSTQDLQQVVSDGVGGAIITWEDFRSGDWAVYAQRVNGAGVIQWTPNGVALCSASGYGRDKRPQIVSDGSAGAIVTWHDTRYMDLELCDVYYQCNHDIFAQRIDASGVVLWTANGVALCTATGDQVSPVIEPDGDGGAIVAWNDTRNATSDIFAQRISAAGAVQWAADGVPVSAGTGNQSIPVLTSDGDGGAIVAWVDQRGIANQGDIYAQRMDSAGAAQWTTNGVMLCVDPNRQRFGVIVSDFAGGAIVAWEDNRNGFYADIYAQRIDRSGIAQWTPNGVALCTAADYQDAPKCTTDSSGGAIVAWRDYRNGPGADVYAQRVSDTGQIPTWTSAVPYSSVVTVSNSRPNPFSSETVFELALHRAAGVQIEVFDLAGRKVRAIDLGRLNEGTARLTFDGRDDHGKTLPSGLYLCRIHVGNETVTRKVVIES